MALEDFPRYPLMFGPSPVHPLPRLSEHLGGPQIWAKREDVNSGLAFGGNKTRKLEYIVPDYVHVLAGGRIVKSGGKELALELEEKGYEWLTGAVEEVAL